ncbi:hypothetical protein AGABI1DRAFT_91720 [Agaricus bisporus var. burnettii JB137-S8]|uniref:Uncharacterized protein n=1 Tax=Agaricus bisporus var. burnettii (strain JB137-S8 / ATCC MYA-4627 / FGSC 10392) TaxID=597362 RepID=K5X7E1_AGABU|nr:uncharacterized protein AGABI1DRAFT_91720 [Agaricus bisporus var. burnettii JB137-S8]EKM79083.1 hypothetical protein AGABI1DRAFT_91720 [Agaricus bisporus var. burnettii JB137-S8]
MNANQSKLEVFMYNYTLKQRTIDRQCIPAVIKPVLRWVWPKIVEHIKFRGIPVPLKGLISTGNHSTMEGGPRVKIGLFDAKDLKIGVLTVYPEIDDFELDLSKGEFWANGKIEDLRVGFTVVLIEHLCVMAVYLHTSRVDVYF